MQGVWDLDAICALATYTRLAETAIQGPQKNNSPPSPRCTGLQRLVAWPGWCLILDKPHIASYLLLEPWNPSFIGRCELQLTSFLILWFLWRLWPWRTYNQPKRRETLSRTVQTTVFRMPVLSSKPRILASQPLCCKDLAGRSRGRCVAKGCI